MPKMKTRKAVANKFKVTSNGQLMHRRCNKRKGLSFKSSKRKRRLSRFAALDTKLAATFKRLIGA